MDSAKPPANFPKQAVVVIHGIGEQRPMDTITGFVRSVWETDEEISRNGKPHPNEVWSKPDVSLTGSLELRRITTRESTPSDDPRASFPRGARTDFFELYWADLSGGSTLDQVEVWIFGILFRNPVTRVPADVRLAWCLLWFVSLVVLYLAAATVMPADWPLRRFAPVWPRWISFVVSAGLTFCAQKYLVGYVGRVVRYTRATPENIAARAAIRKRGLELLNSLHDADYERIIVVGHSLGAILAYDLVGYFWSSRLASHTINETDPDFPLFRRLEAAVAAVEADPNDAAISECRSAQRVFCHALRKRPYPAPGQTDSRWLITDLVTLGSPLAHAEFLLASSLDDLNRRKSSRELPTSPPVTELLIDPVLSAARDAKLGQMSSKERLMSFNFDGDKWQLHHAAAFSVVRWTNVFDPSRWVFLGDIVSGPVRDKFGPAIIDVNLAELRGPARTFTHTLYWSLGRDGKTVGEPVIALRNALDLGGAKSHP